MQSQEQHKKLVSKSVLFVYIETNNGCLPVDAVENGKTEAEASDISKGSAEKAYEAEFLKSNERSVNSMCDIMEKALQEAREGARKEAKEEARRETEEMAYRVYKAEKAKETAEKAKENAEKAKETAEKASRESKRLTIRRLLDKNKMTYEEIAEVVSATLAEVEEIARTA